MTAIPVFGKNPARVRDCLLNPPIAVDLVEHYG